MHPLRQLTGFRVTLEAQHDLRCTVPSGSHVLGHITSILVGIDRETSRKTEIADLELAVGIDQQITGLQISV